MAKIININIIIIVIAIVIVIIIINNINIVVNLIIIVIVIDVVVVIVGVIVIIYFFICLIMCEPFAFLYKGIALLIAYTILFFKQSAALIGKWHLGINCNTNTDFCHHPLKHGFHHFYGLPLTNLRNCGEDGGSVFELVIPHWRKWILAAAVTSVVLSMTFYQNGKIPAWILILLLSFSALAPISINHAYVFVMRNLNCILMQDFEVVEQPVLLKNLTVRFTSNAIRFIEKNKEKPFLLFMSFAKVHNVLFTSKAFEGHSGHSRYGDAVEEMDWAVGKIMVTLETLGLREDTFVYFTSDHGPHLEDITADGEYHGGWKGNFRGGKDIL